MVIRVNHKKTFGKIIEWADQAKKVPIAFILKCPHCRKEQWAHKKHLYIGYNNSKNNYRCKYCGVGLAKKRLNSDEGYSGPSNGFYPKCPGWRSINDQD